MFVFMIRFLLCNVYLCGIIGILFLLKHIYRKILSPRRQYQIWILFLCLLAVPFLPFSLESIWGWFPPLRTNSFLSNTKPAFLPDVAKTTGFAADLANEFAVSVSQKTDSLWGYVLMCIWFFGMLIACIKLYRSYQQLRILEKSALPLQSISAHQLFASCMQEYGIKREIPVFTTAFLYTPILVGFWKPRIYIPLSILTDSSEDNLRFILMHELAHHKHKDNLINHFINLAGILYWFHPFVRYALKEMRNDREIVCDAAVLEMLDASQRLEYGNTLLRFAEKNAQKTFFAAASLMNSKKQIKKRILHIAQYETASKGKQQKGFCILVCTALFLCGISPTLSIYGIAQNHYDWDTSSQNMTPIDLSSYFGDYEGSFVLYDLEGDTWQIYNIEQAEKRVPPDSTYKIYDALFALEEGIITPGDSFMPWNGQKNPFAAWNADQTLPSAMASSVNWYFQAIDAQLGKDCLSEYFQKIGYGNEIITGDISSYWLESSLKISPIEQVELLVKSHQNEFDFAAENIEAVKEAIKLSTSSDTVLYGKTGTGRIDGNDINGWFVGSAQNRQHTYFFACNIQSNTNATGSRAAEIALSILSDLHILSEN